MGRKYYWNFWLGQFWHDWVTPGIMLNAALSFVVPSFWMIFGGEIFSWFSIWMGVSSGIFLFNILVIALLTWWNER